MTAELYIKTSFLRPPLLFRLVKVVTILAQLKLLIVDSEMLFSLHTPKWHSNPATSRKHARRGFYTFSRSRIFNSIRVPCLKATRRTLLTYIAQEPTANNTANSKAYSKRIQEKTGRVM
jgi:hypothetical protein